MFSTIKRAGPVLLGFFCVPVWGNLSKSSPSGEEAWRLNCGAASFDYTDPAGNWWVKDEPFASLNRWGFDQGEAAAPSTRPINGTDMPAVFQTHRFGDKTLAYRLEVPRGTYQVQLLFAETVWNAPGQRVFDVALEGKTVLSHHDVFAEEGRDAADEHTFLQTVTDGVLDITFPAVYADKAMISGVVVKPMVLTDDDFLDFVEKKIFGYFWNEANPTTGLVKDLENNWQTGFADYSSIAGTGFGLSALTVGASRGWITPQQARDRIMAALNLVDSGIPNTQGFWFHFLRLDNGARIGITEVSNIDSAIFVAAALQAGEYFRTSFPEIAAKADSLYRRMNWTFWLNRHPLPDHPDDQFMNQGWKPEFDDGGAYVNAGAGGFFCNDWWNRYSETVLIDLMALGSPTFPIPASAWTQMRRRWANGFGFNYIHEPPLFTQQYQGLYFDFRNRHDGFANYNENQIQATLYNREFCAQKTSVYEPNRWGITSCTSPPGVNNNPNEGYYAYGVMPEGFDDGTVAPTAALASMAHTPLVSIPAARYMYFQYKHHIWGRYGYSDSFNVQQDFRSTVVSALNQGPILLAIENYRTGLIRDSFMRTPAAAQGLLRAGFKNYAAAPLAVASSRQNEAARIIDGNAGTRWGAEDLPDPQWVGVDFGSPKSYNQVVLNWEAAYARSYKLQISDDGLAWTDVYTTTKGDGGLDIIPLPSLASRFVRVLCTQRATSFPYSLWEMTVSRTSGPSKTDGTSIDIQANVP